MGMKALMLPTWRARVEGAKTEVLWEEVEEEEVEESAVELAVPVPAAGADGEPISLIAGKRIASSLIP